MQFLMALCGFHWKCWAQYKVNHHRLSKTYLAWVGRLILGQRRKQENRRMSSQRIGSDRHPTHIVCTKTLCRLFACEVRLPSLSDGDADWLLACALVG
jgi:hypothetical protein